MPDHLIRLRGGWEPYGAVPQDLKRSFALPAANFPGRDAPEARISRRFQAPRLDPATETLWLRLDAVPGLVSVVLNGREIARGPFTESPLLIPLGEGLPARNQLTLGVNTLSTDLAPGPDFRWGEVALLIRRSDPL